MQKEVERQLSLVDTSEEYKAFVEKFKPKKTTDDCYTPANIYQAIADWVAKEYQVDQARFIRPFYPGGDYERHPYQHDDIVVDNPPFSIISQIVTFYERNKIQYFLFSPYLTNLNIKASNHIIIDASIIYQNGANVATAFVSNLDTSLVRTAPDLNKAIEAANKANVREGKKEIPKFSYPDAVLTATAVGKYSKYGIDFRVNAEDALFIRRMDSQIHAGKQIFGGGYLLSERAAAERAAAERAAAERAVAESTQVTKWKLSERERELQKSLGREHENTEGNRRG